MGSKRDDHVACAADHEPCCVVDNIYAAMAEAVSGSSLVICLVSPEYIQSTNCTREVMYAADNGKQLLRVNVHVDSNVCIPGSIGLVSNSQLNHGSVVAVLDRMHAGDGWYDVAGSFHPGGD